MPGPSNCLRLEALLQKKEVNMKKKKLSSYRVVARILNRESFIILLILRLVELVI
jgi:hypothetical protein